MKRAHIRTWARLALVSDRDLAMEIARRGSCLDAAVDRRVVALVGIVAIGGIVYWLQPAAKKSEPEPIGSSTSSSVPSSSNASASPPVAIPTPRIAPSAIDPSAHRFEWGNRDGDVGRERRQEGNAEGPMSLAIGPDGTTYVLDQVNGRITRIGKDGKPMKAIAVPVTAAQDIAVTSDGKLAVLDRLSDKTVAIVDADGKVLGRLPIEGAGIKEGGGVTGVFVDGKKVWAEYEHGTLVSLGDTSGNADTDRAVMSGRPSRDGQYLWSAGITDMEGGILWLSSILRASMEHRFTKQLKMGMPVRAIVLLDTDKQGIVYLGSIVEPAQEAVLLTCIAPSDGHVLGSVQLPPNTMPEESFRDFAVQEEGGVVYQQRSEQGVTLAKYDCR